MQKLNYNNYSFDGHPIRITLHWTGGSYIPSSLDAEHYQFLIGYDGEKATTYIGQYSVEDQDSTNQDYAAHTQHFNTKNIGIALCGMAGAQENGTFGVYPITVAQIDEMVRLCAYLCGGYGISPEPESLASHCEINAIHEVEQPGKWDVSALASSEKTWTALNDDFRQQVRKKMNLLSDPPVACESGGSKPTRDEIKAALDALIVVAESLKYYATVARGALK